MISKVDNGIGSVTNFLKWVLLDLGCGNHIGLEASRREVF